MANSSALTLSEIETFCDRECPSTDNCHLASRGLKDRISDGLNIDCYVRTGEFLVDRENRELGEYDHSWIVVPEYEVKHVPSDVIVDPTAEQFALPEKQPKNCYSS